MFKLGHLLNAQSIETGTIHRVAPQEERGTKGCRVLGGAEGGGGSQTQDLIRLHATNRILEDINYFLQPDSSIKGTM